MNLEDFCRFRAEEGEEPTFAEMLIFSTIGDWEDMGDVSARAFARELAKLPSSVKRLDIHINSPGGSVFEAQGIYSRLADHRSQKIVYVDGLAASAASIIAMIGHKIYIRANANMMIHLPSGIVLGNADDMRHMATALDSVTESMINVYAKKTSLERDEIRSMLAAETWFSPETAVEKGFADEVRGVVKAAAVVGEHKAIFNGAEFDLSRFHNVPAFTASTTKPKTMAKPKEKSAVAAVEDPPTPNGNGNEHKEDTPAPPPGPPTPPAPEPPLDPKKVATATEFDKGVEAERARVLALQALDRPATHAVVEAAIKDGKQPSEIFAACMEAMDKAAGKAARHADASVLNNIPPSDGAETTGFGTLLKQNVKSRLKQRGRRAAHNRN